MDRIVNEKIIILVDSQAAILAIQNNIVKSNTVLTCIKNLNILGKDNDVTIAWTPAHTGIQGNEKADILARAGTRTDPTETETRHHSFETETRL